MNYNPNLTTQLPYNQAQNKSLYNRLGNNLILVQEQNINPNRIFQVNNSEDLTKIKNINNSISSNKIIQNNKNKEINISKSILASGKLLISSRSCKFNKVLKNGKKIKNIDMNSDYEDMPKDDTESTSTYYNNENKSNLNMPKIKSSSSTNDFKKLTRNKKDQLNKINKTSNTSIQFNGNQLIQSVKQRFSPKGNTKKVAKNVNPVQQEKDDSFSTNKSPFKIKSIEKLSPKWNSKHNRISRNIDNNIDNNSLIKSKSNTSNLNEKSYSKNMNKKNIYSKDDLSNSKLNKNKNKAENTAVVPKKEDDIISKKNESNKSNDQYPIQNVPINNPNVKNINIPNNTNANDINNNMTDNYLISHLGEYMQNETFPLPLNVEDNLNNNLNNNINSNINSNTKSNINSNTTNNINSNINSNINNNINNDKNNISHKGFRLCSELTKAGKNEDGNTKIDQDTPLICLSVGGILGFNLFGVLDGHGLHGHFVSQFCREYFIKNMIDYIELLKQQTSTLTAEQLYNILKSDGFNYISELYNRSDTELVTQNKFDYEMSGTTCNIVFQFNNHLVCVSVGDSRGILIYDKGDSRNEGIIPLSTDHKPDLPDEYQRIQFYGGEVNKVEDIFGNKLGPARVYKAGFNYPGLAMSRSLGDLQAKECGVIPTPQIIEYDINFSSKYMVICSDGVWEFISNEQVRDLGNFFYQNNDISGFCTELIKMSEEKWAENEIIRDDITVVSVFF